MNLLLNDKLAPITSEIGFIEANLEEATNTFFEWQQTLMKPLGIHLHQHKVSGSLANVVRSLLPLTSVERVT